MTPQTLTITGRATAGTPLAPEVPHLEVSGQWLLAAGFPAGSRVQVEEVEPGLLVLSRAPEEVDDPRLRRCQGLRAPRRPSPNRL